MSDEQKKVDAVMIPVALAGGGDLRAKSNRLAKIARPLLGLNPNDPISIPLGNIDGCYFVYAGAMDRNQTVLFATTHDRAGEHRHEWTSREDGVKLGTLKEDKPE
jgi:hypothetical protein